jgi:DNA-binding XRE family transcriptional regulator
MFRFFKRSRPRSVQAVDARETIRPAAGWDTKRHTAPPGAFGELLRYHRTNAHRTQEEFAKHAGISLSVLTALENGQWAGDDKAVRRIAVALFLSQAQEKALTEAWEALRRPSILP